MEKTRILNGIDKGLRCDFDKISEQHFNPNTKGHEYEKAWANFLEGYFSGLFDFHVRSALLDRDMKALEAFAPAKNEFDVIATFKNACPRIVLEVGDTEFIPYDAVAFITEVKQTLTVTGLKEDLEKLNKLNSFDCSQRFGGITFTSSSSIERPLKTLFYLDATIAEDTLHATLLSNVASWDLLLVLSKDEVLGNRELPIVREVGIGKEKLEIFSPHSLLQFILLTESSMTLAPLTDTTPVFVKLLESSEKKETKAT
jgi:hypothetical protein